MDFYESCLEVMNSYVREGKNVVLCGDVLPPEEPWMSLLVATLLLLDSEFL